ncbi:tetratricopeptide repeat protein [Pontibacter kalidii]|uniref:tetratricopeptide repeat protein n=1 Tax=Pontibacter kalidii TaxID=2592049 RepID=UPI00224D9981|nr:tetratricopeptide repeat protein [Pontibacter kalidii]
MKRSQILIVVVAIVLVVGLFFLPKIVVNNEDQDSVAGTENSAGLPEGHSEDDGHDHGSAEAGAVENVHRTATPEQMMALTTARAKYNKATDEQTRSRVAVELGEAYANAAKYDSAGYYYEVAAKTRGGEKSFRRAGDAYYEAFTFAATQERAGELGAKARSMYEQVLKNNPSDHDAKTNVAMTYIATSNPMQGITMLREVLASAPNNQKALFNLGILSIQSNQYDKAVGHFRKLVSVNPQHVEGTFYLAVALAETEQNEEAKALFNKVKSMSNDPALNTSVDEYLARLQ